MLSGNKFIDKDSEREKPYVELFEVDWFLLGADVDKLLKF